VNELKSFAKDRRKNNLDLSDVAITLRRDVWPDKQPSYFCTDPKRHRYCRGFTLIEVVLGLVLLATLLVALMLAAARLRRLDRLAHDRQAATLVADHLLAGWLDSATGIPVASVGPIAGRPDWVWRTTLIRNQLIFGVPTAIVRLDVTSAPAGTVLVSLQVAVRIAASHDSFQGSALERTALEALPRRRSFQGTALEALPPYDRTSSTRPY
jgi:prepilin-type N-terminal cleavage/methylation domain-containing protein